MRDKTYKIVGFHVAFSNSVVLPILPPGLLCPPLPSLSPLMLHLPLVPSSPSYHNLSVNQASPSLLWSTFTLLLKRPGTLLHQPATFEIHSGGDRVHQLSQGQFSRLLGMPQILISGLDAQSTAQQVQKVFSKSQRS